VSPAQLVFTTASWNQPQTVTVTGVDDALADGAQAYAIVTGPLVSTDVRYSGLNPVDVPAHNLDDEQVAVAVKLVSGVQSCAAPSGFVPIATDSGGAIYVVMACDGGQFLVTSTDGGKTFTDPTVIPGTESSNGQAFIAGGPAGVLYLVSETNDGQVTFERTTNGGTTWSTPVVLATTTDVVRLRAAGKTVVVLTPGTDGTNMRLSRSVDGGRTFLPAVFPKPVDIDAAVAPGGQTVWLLALDGSDQLRKSLDMGATFSSAGMSPASGDVRAFGRSHLYFFAGNVLSSVAFADLATEASSTLNISTTPFAMATDELDDLALVDSDPDTGRLRATHLSPTAVAPLDSRLVGPSSSQGGVAPLSHRAAAVDLISGNVVLYTTIVWQQ